MPRTPAELPRGARITDFISLGVIAKNFPRKKIDKILRETGRQSVRQRKLPAHVVVYYVIVLGFYAGVSYGEVLRCLLEGFEWLGWEVKQLRRTAKSAISQARKRLGPEPLARLFEEVVKPIARRKTIGAWYRQHRLVVLDGSTLEVGDTRENESYFGRPGASRGKSGYPQVRLVCLAESGTHVIFGAGIGKYSTSENELATHVLPRLQADMLCLADRNYFSYGLWKAAMERASLLWRVKKNMKLPCLERFDDDSYLSKVYPSLKARRHDTDGIEVRVVEYRLEGVEGAEPIYRLITTLLAPDEAPAQELAALYHERWEIENALDELKTHLRGARMVLRSKTPELVLQEVYGLLLAYYALRGLMHEAALKGGVDPDEISFVHTVRVVRRKLPRLVAFPPSGKNSTP